MIIRKSESNIYPQINYNINEVLEPSNIVKIEREFDGLKDVIYAYTETVYTLAEWQKLKDDESAITQEAINFLLMGGM